MRDVKEALHEQDKFISYINLECKQDKHNCVIIVVRKSS